MNLEPVAVAVAREADQLGLDHHGMVRLLAAHAFTVRHEPWLPCVADTFELSYLLDPSHWRGYRSEDPLPGEPGAPAASIPELMISLFRNVDDAEPVEFVDQFLAIRPFPSHNEEMGWLLLNWLNRSLDSPVRSEEIGMLVSPLDAGPGEVV
jgi:hypothetical protein